MSIQSSINTMIGSIAAVKKAHDYGLQQKANQKMEEQKLAIQKQKIALQEYRAKTQRKALNFQIKNKKEEDSGVYLGGQKITDPNLINKLKGDKINGKQ